MTGFVDQFLHVGRQVAGKAQPVRSDRVDEAEHRWLLEHPGIELSIDVKAQVIALPDGGHIRFRLEPFARHCLLNGVDQLGYLQQHQDAITAYEQRVESIA